MLDHGNELLVSIKCRKYHDCVIVASQGLVEVHAVC